MDSIAIIPARGGSKRIPRKNIRELAGKPAISYPIELAIKTGIFKRVIVSTDDIETAQIAESSGAEVPFLRESKLSDDFTTTIDVISNAISKIDTAGIKYVCCIYPVTPLLNIDRVMESYKILSENIWDYVFSACEFPAPIERAFRKNDLGEVNFLNSNFVNTRTQDLSKAYYDSGQFYFGQLSSWKSKRPILTGNSTFIELEKNEVLDIDEEEDWNLVERLLRLRNDSKS